MLVALGGGVVIGARTSDVDVLDAAGVFAGDFTIGFWILFSAVANEDHIPFGPAVEDGSNGVGLGSLR